MPESGGLPVFLDVNLLRNVGLLASPIKQQPQSVNPSASVSAQVVNKTKQSPKSAEKSGKTCTQTIKTLIMEK